MFIKLEKKDDWKREACTCSGVRLPCVARWLALDLMMNPLILLQIVINRQRFWPLIMEGSGGA